jgi:hypothetical protein
VRMFRWMGKRAQRNSSESYSQIGSRNSLRIRWMDQPMGPCE